MVIDKSKLRRFCRSTDHLLINDTAYAEVVALKLQMLGATSHTYYRALSGDLMVVTCFYPELVGGTEILMMRRTSPGKGLNAIPTGAWVVHFDSAVKFLKHIREATNG